MIEDFLLYTDSDGLVQNTPYPNRGATGNGLLYTCMTAILFESLRVQLHFNLFQVILACKVAAGLYKRSPVSDELEAQDDYIGIATVCLLCAREIANYGSNHYWIFDWKTPGRISWNQFLGRNPSFIAHIKFCAGIKPNIGLKLLWCFAVATAGLLKPSNQDEWVLSYLLCRAAPRDAGWLVGLTKRIWLKRFKRAWPGGFKALYAKYFNDSNHPLSKYGNFISMEFV